MIETAASVARSENDDSPPQVTRLAQNAKIIGMMFKTWRWPLIGRVLLAGPVTIVISLLVVGSLPLWFPKGVSGIDRIALPIIFLPAIWAALFFHAVLDRSLTRVAMIALGLAGFSIIMLVWKLSNLA